MAYLGNDLQVAYQSYKIIDDISSSFNSSLTSFPLQVGGVAPVPFPINPQQCLISVNGVVQEPDPTGTSGFNLVGSNIVFASAPTTGHSFFGVILAGADYVNVGVNYPSGSESAPSITFDTDLDTGIYNPAANELGLVTNGNDAVRINSSGDVTIDSDLTVDTDTLYVDSANDRVGIGTSNPLRLFQVEGTGGQLAVIQATAGDSILRVDAQPTAGAESYLWCRASTTGLGSVQFGTDVDGDVGKITYDFSDNNLQFRVNGDERMRIDSSGRLLVGTSSWSGSVSKLVNVGNTSNSAGAAVLTAARGESAGTIVDDDLLARIEFTDQDANEFAYIEAFADAATGSGDYPGRLVFSTTADGASSPTERCRITSAGALMVGKSTNEGSQATAGVELGASGYLLNVRNGDIPLFVNRLANDGVLVNLSQDGTTEGSISVSGTTVSYNGAHLSRWSQLPGGAEREEILRGTVLSNIDEMCAWGEEDNEQLNRMKVSDVEGDKDVAGVFQSWDDDDDTYTNDFYCAMTGDFVIRIAQGVTVQRGDLLMSAGDGTAKPQDDDIIRSKTIAKVTSTYVSETYADGSYCVPCVLMAC